MRLSVCPLTHAGDTHPTHQRTHPGTAAGNAGAEGEEHGRGRHLWLAMNEEWSDDVGRWSVQKKKEGLRRTDGRTDSESHTITNRWWMACLRGLENHTQHQHHERKDKSMACLRGLEGEHGVLLQHPLAVVLRPARRQLPHARLLCWFLCVVVVVVGGGGGLVLPGHVWYNGAFCGWRVGGAVVGGGGGGGG